MRRRWPFWSLDQIILRRKSLPSRRRHLLEFPMSCLWRKCLTNFCSAFLAGQYCLILRTRRLICQQRIQPWLAAGRPCSNVSATLRAIAIWESFRGDGAGAGRAADFVTLYLYVHRVRDCEPGVYRWDGSSRGLEQLHRGNVERVAAYLSLEQALAGNACLAVSMVADLAAAAKIFGNRGYRYVHFEAGAIGQRLYLGAEALGWNATGIGAFYDDDVHRYLGFLEEKDNSVLG